MSVRVNISFSSNTPKYDVDICVYGGTSAGVIAAYTAKQMGRSTVLDIMFSQFKGMFLHNTYLTIINPQSFTGNK